MEQEGKKKDKVSKRANLKTVEELRAEKKKRMQEEENRIRENGTGWAIVIFFLTIIGSVASHPTLQTLGAGAALRRRVPAEQARVCRIPHHNCLFIWVARIFYAHAHCAW